MTRIRLLMIETEDRDAKLAQLVLDSDGWVVRHVATVAAARRLLREAEPQLITTELMLTDLQGIAVVDALRAIAPAIPIAVVTALNGPETERRARAAGCAAFIQKPIDVSQYSAQLRAILEGVK